jgi:DNA repair exonuclease SbcCD ATPase subunit
MKIKALVAENFLSFKELTYAFPDQGLYFIGGEKIGSSIAISNGAGKSAFTEALCWCLFGKTIRNFDADNIVNWDVKKDCAVHVIVEDDSGQEYEISRFRNHTENGNELYLMRDLKDLTGSTTATTQKEIDKILGMNWPVFISAIIFGERARRFAEAKEAEKKEIFDEILLSHLDFVDAQKKAKADLNDLRMAVVTLGVQIEQADGLESQVVYDIGILEEEKTEIEEKKESVAVQINEIKTVITNCRKKREGVQKKWDVAQDKYAGLKKLATKSNELYVEVMQQKEKAGKGLLLQQSDAGKNLEVARTNAASFKARLAEYTVVKDGGECPTCFQPLKDAKKLKDKIATYTKNLLNEESLVKNFKSIYDALAKQEEIENEKWNKKIDGVIANEGEAEKAVETKLDDINDYSDKMKDIVHEIELKKQEIESLEKSHEQEEQHILKEIERKKDQIKKYQKARKKAEDKITELKDKEEYLKFWVEGFGNQGLKSFLIETIIPALNDQVGYYASALLDSTIQIEFDTETVLKSGETRDKFNIKLTIDGKETNYKSYSSGEKGRIDTAILLALQNLIFSRGANNSNLIIFDEIFEHLDIIGIERTVNLLKEEAKDKAIYVISHQNEFADYFENVIMIKNEKGISRLEA